MNEFDQKLFNALSDFRTLAVDTIEEGRRVVPRLEGIDNVDVKKSMVKSGLSSICPKRNFDDYKKVFFNHFNDLNRYIPFCSSPQSFRNAWNLRSETLNNYDAINLINQGAQLIPVNNESRIFTCEQQGPLYGKDKRLILGVRHSEGNYEDELDEKIEFEYQPPINCSGFLKYRWCHYLSEKLEIPYILLVIMWFEYRISENLNQAFVIAPAKIINDKNQLDDLDKNLHLPLNLQIISRQEAINSLLVLDSRRDNIGEIAIRSPLNEDLSREWTYLNINSSKKGRKIKAWARNSGKKCPGNNCNHKPFKQVNPSEIAFGHIISQKWSKAFSYLLNSVHHPDNLYLTCSSCNSALSDNFPPPDLRNKIDEFGTIGDWIRKAEKQIRDTDSKLKN